MRRTLHIADGVLETGSKQQDKPVLGESINIYIPAPEHPMFHVHDIPAHERGSVAAKLHPLLKDCLTRKPAARPNAGTISKRVATLANTYSDSSLASSLNKMSAKLKEQVLHRCIVTIICLLTV